MHTHITDNGTGFTRYSYCFASRLVQRQIIGDEHRLADFTRIEQLIVFCSLVETYALLDKPVEQLAIRLQYFERIVKVPSDAAAAKLKADTGVS